MIGSRLQVASRRMTLKSFRLASSLVGQFENAVGELPMREAVRYTTKNMKWTAQQYKEYVDAHANAIIELELLKKGDTITLWLPEGAEKHVTLLACAKMGIKVFDIDSTVTSVAQLRNCLKSSACKIIFFDPVDETKNKLEMLRKAIPEFYEYDDQRGQRFHSKYFPNLEYFVHTGFDVELGCLNYKALFLPHPERNWAQEMAAGTSDDLPLYCKLTAGADGNVTESPTVAQGKVLESDTWSFAKNLISKQYFENP